jgi:hypothetical protein
VKPKSSLKDGGTITTPNDHTVHWVTAHLRQRPSCPWTKGQSCTNFQIGPLKWGCSDNAPRSVMFRLFYVVENNQGVFQENFLYD